MLSLSRSSPSGFMLLFMLLLLVAFESISAFHIPGVSPHSYLKNDPIDLKYNKIFSDKTHLPFEYSVLPVCKPLEDRHLLENLGEVLRGDRIQLSPIKINMQTPITCQAICDKIEVDEKTSKRLEFLVKADYKVEWIIENLPGATPYKTSETGDKQYEQGFLFGRYDKEKKQAYLHNHFSIVIMYHDKPEEYEGSRIVGFEVYPKSISSEGRTACPTDIDADAAPQEVGKATSILYTYSVEFREDKGVEWADRWNFYLINSDAHIHWYSIVNSVIILMFLSAMVAVIMLRTLNHDISTYNQEDLKEEQEEVTGWKLVHGDVFRQPKSSGLLAALLGTGLQFSGMILVTMAFSLFGFLNPSYRGGMLSFAAFLFVFMGAFGGYYSARFYKAFKGSSWQKNALLTGTLVPGILFGIFFLLDLFIWSQQSSSAIPFGTFVALVVLWFCISLPLVFLGAYFGQKKKPFEYPVRTNQIPRQIPETSWFLSPLVSVSIGGLLPFAVIFIELFFIMTSVWQDQYYYLYGFATIVFAILVITCVEITVVIIYFQLCSEDYRWWWRSFFISGSSAFYIFLYSLFYYVTRMDLVAFVPGLIYFTYIFMACLVYFLCTGTVGFLACFFALRTIYGAVKVD